MSSPGPSSITDHGERKNKQRRARRETGRQCRPGSKPAKAPPGGRSDHLGQTPLGGQGREA